MFRFAKRIFRTSTVLQTIRTVLAFRAEIFAFFPIISRQTLTFAGDVMAVALVETIARFTAVDSPPSEFAFLSAN